MGPHWSLSPCVPAQFPSRPTCRRRGHSRPSLDDAAGAAGGVSIGTVSGSSSPLACRLSTTSSAIVLLWFPRWSGAGVGPSKTRVNSRSCLLGLGVDSTSATNGSQVWSGERLLQLPSCHLRDSRSHQVLLRQRLLRPVMRQPRLPGTGVK